MKWVVGLKTNTMLMIVERKVKRGGAVLTGRQMGSMCDGEERVKVNLSI